MKIDIISHIYPTKRDPSSGIFIQKEAQLISSKYQVELFIPTVRSLPFQSQFYRTKNPVDERFLVSNIRYLSFPKRKWPRFTVRNLANSLTKHLSESKSDILHFHWLYPAGLTIPTLKKLRKPALLTLHGGDWYSNQNKGIDELIEETFKSCDAIVCVGNQLKKDIEVKYPYLKNKLCHIPHGIDTNKFKPAESATEFKHLDWDFSVPNLLCVANLYPVKGIDLLIKAFNSFPESINAHLHIVAPRRDPEYSKLIYELVSLNNLKEKITFYPSMGEMELIPFYKAADLFISPSKKEGFGLAIGEAIACGTPVVVTKSGGPEEIVSQRVGLQVTNGNNHKLTQGILSALKNLEKFDEKVLHAHIKSSFNNSSKLNSLTNIYSSILS